ncbi:carbohydrate ABC transporter permease [Paenibacillus aceris]|uniref:Aldouronate transport system permease protein n=1 Tax=Paenibacillus aceris TaxID=869555 RepID=A0ABS4HX06_9BACL|nr:carbohydrate ABC transporter permease [Paenibacillus aceris]MBP1963179.1 putative aldouronate transport system permease protein [Paenibacillus aceris]NHW38704.1 carbohydrate ABC transporter permease [Paenibacillus aceris]
MRLTNGERTFGYFNTVLMLGLCAVTLYPFLYVLFASFSNSTELLQHLGPLYRPAGFDLSAYKAVFSNPMIVEGYKNTLLYVLLGTTINLIMTSIGAYVLSRPNLYFKNMMMFFIVVTMVFHGGLIPSFLLVNNLGMMNTMWALLIPGAINTFNMIIMRTSFQGIPVSLEESARMDGAGDWTILFRIMIPLSLPVMAVMVLWYAVGHWNSYFSALLYLRNREAYPLQLILRELLIQNSTDAYSAGSSDDKYAIGETIKYAAIIVSTLPILCLYPFLQKYFVHGVLVGAIKE